MAVALKTTGAPLLRHRRAHVSQLASLFLPTYTTDLGAAYTADALLFMRDLADQSVNLVITSPPYALHFKKEYGNVDKHGYVEWMLPFALAVTVLLSSYVVHIQTMWRQAPITAAIVIASGVSSHSRLSGIEHGLHKVAEVLFGCLIGLLVSWAMSRIWPIRRPANPSGPSSV